MLDIKIKFQENFMCKRNVIAAIILMLLMIATTSYAAADQYNWKIVDTIDGCQIYTSAVSGKDYIASKATCVIPARMEVINTLLRDIANYPEWMTDCKETKMLKIVDEQNDVFIFWFRQHIALFPDRDLVIKSKIVIQPEEGKDLIYSDLTNEIPYDAGKGYVRMSSFSSLFTLQWKDRENTTVTYMIDPNLNKGIPSGAANGKIKLTPFKTLQNMKKMVKLSKYVSPAKTNRYHKKVEDGIKNGYLR